MEQVLDSLKIYKRLKSARMEEKSAKEVAEIFSDLMAYNLATKNDLTVLELNLTKEIKSLDLKIEQTKSELLKWVIGLFVAQTGLILTFLKILK